MNEKQFRKKHCTLVLELSDDKKSLWIGSNDDPFYNHKFSKSDVQMFLKIMGSLYEEMEAENP